MTTVVADSSSEKLNLLTRYKGSKTVPDEVYFDPSR